MGEHGQLVVATDRRQYGPDGRVGEGSHQVARPVGGRSVELAGGRVLDRHQVELVPQPLHRQLVHVRELCRGGEGGGDDRDPVTGVHLGRGHEPVGHSALRICCVVTS